MPSPDGSGILFPCRDTPNRSHLGKRFSGQPDPCFKKANWRSKMAPKNNHSKSLICYFCTMRKMLIIAFFVLLSSCSKEHGPVDLSKLNGYWEIEKVLIPDQDKKVYTINDTYDFYELHGKKGSRAKVKPQFDGTFQSNKIAEDFTVLVSDGKTYLLYETPYAKWQEELLTLTDSVMVAKNHDGKEFYFKRATPLNFTDEKTK